MVNKRNIYHISLIKGTNNECSRNFEISEHIKDSLGGLSVFVGYIVSDGSICSLKYSGHLERELTLNRTSCLDIVMTLESRILFLNAMWNVKDGRHLRDMEAEIPNRD